MTLFKLSLKELQDLFTRGEVSALDIARAFLLRMSQVEYKVKAFITPTERETLLAQAETIDKDLVAWRKTMPLMAMPLAIKDNICTDGVRTTCGSVMLEQFTPPYDSTVVAALRGHRYLLLGKTNLDEFAMGSSVSQYPWLTGRSGEQP